MNAPSKILFSLEAIRGLAEYGLSWALYFPLKSYVDKGDGHPVIVIPGLGTADDSTHYVRNFLDSIGYKSYIWGKGRNLGPTNGITLFVQELADYVKQISNENDGKSVSIIGWSLGGIYAREIAKVIPTYVRQVITLGTPFKGDSTSTNAAVFYEFLSDDKSHLDPEVIGRIKEKPPVPFTSIYSKSDGVVAWESSIEDVAPFSENIEIPLASHLGLGHNPISMFVIADRLSQRPGKWLPYKPLMTR